MATAAEGPATEGSMASKSISVGASPALSRNGRLVVNGPAPSKLVVNGLDVCASVIILTTYRPLRALLSLDLVAHSAR
jgi:hypothetical protein